MKINLGTTDINVKAKSYVNDVLDSGWLSSHKYIPRFETQLARLHGHKFGVMMNSGTDALRIAVAVLKEAHKWKDGDEIIIPAVTFVATVNVIIQNNLKPVFVDVDYWTYNLDPFKIEIAITKKTKAIMPVHMFGLPSDMDAIMPIAKKYRLKVIEDSCESMFCRSIKGDMGCFSTYISHVITTGVGGVLTTSNRNYEGLARSYMNHGRDLSVPLQFKFDRIGYSSRATEMEAALGCEQLERYQDISNKRKDVGNKLYYKLREMDLCHCWRLPCSDNGISQNGWKGWNDHAFMMFPIMLKHGNRGQIMKFLWSKGIETREMMPLVNQTPYAKYYTRGSCKVAEEIADRGFYVPCHHNMTIEEIDYIADTLGDYFKKSCPRMSLR